MPHFGVVHELVENTKVNVCSLDLGFEGSRILFGFIWASCSGAFMNTNFHTCPATELVYFVELRL